MHIIVENGCDIKDKREEIHSSDIILSRDMKRYNGIIKGRPGLEIRVRMHSCMVSG